MDNVVPGPLRRLREADIIDLAGLESAALGQEYYRIGAVHTTMQQGSQITGIVDVPLSLANNASGVRLPGTADISDLAHEKAASPTKDVMAAWEVQEVQTTKDVDAQPGRYAVKVELRDSSKWNAICTCGRRQAHAPTASSNICPHAAALLYQWLAHPTTFVSPHADSSHTMPSSYAIVPERMAPPKPAGAKDLKRASLRAPTPHPADAKDLKRAPQASLRVPTEEVSIVEGEISELLSQLGLSELRAIAREYEISRTGMNKQQLVEAMVEVLKQPEMIRKVVGTLEKPQRQLLAALTLAGGTVTDEELRGLYERFSLGYANQLQAMLSALRSKCLLFRITCGESSINRDATKEFPAINRGTTQGHMGSLLDVGWYVPSEVRAVLRVTVPITPFEVQNTKAGTDGGGHRQADAPTASLPPKLEEAKPYSLLNDLLLVARALDGRAEGDGKDRPSIGDVDGGGRVNRTMEARTEAGTDAPPRGREGFETRLVEGPYDGLMLVPPPLDMPSPSLLESLQVVVPRPAAFLLFTFRLLRLVDILYKDDAGTPYLRILPNAARLLLGPTCTEVAHDLFVRWLTQPTYAELFELQEEGLRLRCRSGPLGRPALHTGELEMDNSEARQMLVALLAKVPLNQWINFSAFARFVYRLNPAFLQRRHNLFSSPPWWLEQEEGRTLHPTQWNDWLRAEGRYIARLLRGPLHWWGISDVALSNSGQLLAFRLTPLASLLVHGSISAPQADRPRIIADSASNRRETTAWLMSSPGGREGFETRLAEGPYDQDAPQMLTLSENGDILISSSPVEWPLIELLEDFAEVAGVQAGRLCYRLTAASLAEALSRGLNPTHLLQLLHQHADAKELIRAPQAPLRVSTPLLTELECRIKNYGRVRLYTDVTLLEVADTLVMRELSATTPLEEQVVRTIHPTLLILKKQGAERIVQDLKRRGQVPLLHEEEDYGAE